MPETVKCIELEVSLCEKPDVRQLENAQNASFVCMHLIFSGFLFQEINKNIVYNTINTMLWCG